jgi:SAM-dependent methyltransferase
MSTLFDWSPEKIEYYRRASEYTGFFRELFQLSLPYFGPDDEVVDLGCGLGLFDILLAPHVRHIDAIDVHPYAVAYLRGALAEDGITNVDATLSDTADFLAADKHAWDVVFMSFFGEGSDTFTALLKQARKRMVMITHNDGKKRECPAGPPSRRLSTAASISAYLDERGIAYKRGDHVLDFGQPLKSLADAGKFAACYATKGGFEEVLPVLTRVSADEYSYFLPKERNISLFVVDTGGGLVVR